MMDCPAYVAMSHGAKCLYHALKRRVPREHQSRLSVLQNGAERIESELNKVKEWFAELEHYGFIVLASTARLGSMARARPRTGG